MTCVAFYVHIYIYIYIWVVVLTFRIEHMGNPRFYATFLDEHYNGKVAQICRSAHRRNFEKTVFGKFHLRYAKHKVGKIIKEEKRKPYKYRFRS